MSSLKPSTNAGGAIRQPMLKVLIFGLAILPVTVGVAPAEASKTDHTPPKFAGLKSAVTCLPGPIGPGRSSSYHLSWDPATDDFTPSSQIVYHIYQAATPGGEDFSTPTYTTARGAVSFDTPQLPSDQAVYFVVRARDRAGNEDTNTMERQGQNICL